MEPGEPTFRQPQLPLVIRRLALTVTAGANKGETFGGESDCVTVGTALDNDLVLSDPAVSRYHFEVRRERADIWVRDLGSTNGTHIGNIRLSDGAASVAPNVNITVGDSTVRIQCGEDNVVAADAQAQIEGVVARSESMRRVLADVGQIAKKNVPVLIMGESGTGKEKVAEALHQLSDRHAEPFVTVQCGAIAPSLFASELFGHVAGSFTGAVRDHPGAFERASGGTLFLDELGELPADQQAALLGVLERGIVRRVGDTHDRHIDVRTVCATNRDLRAEVNAGSFRLDLYYRVAVVHLRIPPLRERREDIAALIAHFLAAEGYLGPLGDVFPGGTLLALAEHRWPGNARELRNHVRATLALGAPPSLTDSPAGAATIAEDTVKALLDSLAERPFHEAKRLLLERFEHHYLAAVLKQSKGSVKDAAELAGVNRSHLSGLLKRHKLR